MGELAIPEEIEGCPVTSIARKAALSRKSLRKVMLPSSLTSLGDWAFAYCSSLEEVFLPDTLEEIGRAVFLECGRLRRIRVFEGTVPEGQPGRGTAEPARQTVSEKEIFGAAGCSELLAAAVTVLDAAYLFVPAQVGTGEWLQKWDARLIAFLRADDQEGYSKQVLCGEEDYGSTDLGAFLNRKRQAKVEMALLRLLSCGGLAAGLRKELEEYLLGHVKGCTSEETWEVILKHSGERRYYELFAELGGISQENFDDMLKDMGDDCPEMKAYLLRYKENKLGGSDFFESLSLDF